MKAYWGEHGKSSFLETYQHWDGDSFGKHKGKSSEITPQIK